MYDRVKAKMFIPYAIFESLAHTKLKGGVSLFSGCFWFLREVMHSHRAVREEHLLAVTTEVLNTNNLSLEMDCKQNQTKKHIF
jgi:hypothetical protein